MKKTIFYVVLTLGLLGLGGYYFIRTQFTEIVAQAVVTDSLPPYIPKRIQSRIQDISTPLNQGTEAVLEVMETRGIPTEELISTIDQTTEEQVYAMLDELRAKDPSNSHEVFDIAKKHLSTDLDPEIFRKPFTENVSMNNIRKLMKYAGENRRTHDLDFATAKAIVKKIILEKEKDFQSDPR